MAVVALIVFGFIYVLGGGSDSKHHNQKPGTKDGMSPAVQVGLFAAGCIFLMYLLAISNK